MAEQAFCSPLSLPARYAESATASVLVGDVCITSIHDFSATTQTEIIATAQMTSVRLPSNGTPQRPDMETDET